MFDHRKSRAYTSALLDAVDQGMVDKDNLISDLLSYLSEADVEDFVRKNDLLEAINMEDEEDMDCDDSDDGYALASAGFGTDEDYGYAGDDY